MQLCVMGHAARFCSSTDVKYRCAGQATEQAHVIPAADPFSMLEGLSHPAPEPPAAAPGLDLDALYGQLAPSTGNPAGGYGSSMLNMGNHAGGLLGDLASPGQPPWGASGLHAAAQRPDAFGLQPLDGLLGGVQMGSGGGGGAAGIGAATHALGMRLGRLTIAAHLQIGLLWAPV